MIHVPFNPIYCKAKSSNLLGLLRAKFLEGSWRLCRCQQLKLGSHMEFDRIRHICENVDPEFD